MFIDIHVHKSYKEPETVILRNLFPENTNEIDGNGYYSVGLHPWYVKEPDIIEKIDEIARASQNENIIAIGEIGIDAKVDVSFDLQMKAFQMQLAIAEKVRKPVIIHCVRAYNELLSLRKRADNEIPWIIHWFNSGIEMANDLISKNCYLSYGISLFKEESKSFRAFKYLPLERIFFETDDVGISIIQVYEKAASILNVSVQTLQEKIKTNFESCFKLKILG